MDCYGISILDGTPPMVATLATIVVFSETYNLAFSKPYLQSLPERRGLLFWQDTLALKKSKAFPKYLGVPY